MFAVSSGLQTLEDLGEQPVTLYSHCLNHRMVEVGRDLWRSSGPNPLLKQGHLEPVAQDHVQMAFEYLQGWIL